MIGPSRPSERPTGAPSAAAGPELPPHLRKDRAPGSGEDDDDDEEEEDDYAPARPPGRALTAAQGPALPPHLAARQQREPSPDSDAGESSSDEDVGPRPAPASGTGPSLSAAEEFRLREKQKKDEEDARKLRESQKPKREEWMTVPPSALDAMANTDPSKITKTGFNQNSRRGAGAEKASEAGRSLWTETPQERAQRLDDEASGKRKRIENAGKQETDVQKAQRRAREARDAEMRSAASDYNASAARGDSLVDLHTKQASKEQAEAEERARKKSKSKHRKASRSPSPTAPAFWDRDKMMGSAGRMMDEGKRKEIIGSSSTNLSSKFGSGTYL